MYETVAEEQVKGKSGKKSEPFHSAGVEKTALSTVSQAFVRSSLRCTSKCLSFRFLQAALQMSQVFSFSFCVVLITRRQPDRRSSV
jgi:hypothetical protein